MSAASVAKSLRLDRRVIEALEADDYGALPAPIFVKGYLNAYCKLLGLSAQEVLVAYEHGGGKQAPPPLNLGNGTGDQVTSSHARVVVTSWVIGLMAVAMVVLWWMSRTQDVPVLAQEPPAVESQAQATAPELAVVPERPQVARLVLEPVPAAAAEEDVAVDEPPAGWLRVEATFTEDCWTEITDAAGRRLFFELARAGQTVDVEGQGPFSVFLGNSPAARFTVNGRAFDHTRYTRTGNIARFGIQADQVP